MAVRAARRRRALEARLAATLVFLWRSEVSCVLEVRLTAQALLDRVTAGVTSWRC